jgi:hypothetical protein
MKSLKDFFLLTIADSKFMENLFTVTKQAEKTRVFSLISFNYTKTEATIISQEGN